MKEDFPVEQAPPQSMEQLKDAISQALGARVSLNRRRKQLVVSLSNEDHLRRIYKLIASRTETRRASILGRGRFPTAEQAPQTLDRVCDEIGQALGTRVSRRDRWGMIKIIIHYTEESHLRTIRDRIINAS